MKTEKTPNCEIEYLEDIQCVIQHWSTYSGSANFREANNKTVDIFKTKKRVTKIISDSLVLGVVKKEDTDWVAEDINPVLIKLGLKKIAFIVPDSVFAQIAVDNYKIEAKGALAVRYFKNMPDALSWIKDKSK